MERTSGERFNLKRMRFLILVAAAVWGANVGTAAYPTLEKGWQDLMKFLQSPSSVVVEKGGPDSTTSTTP